MQPMRGTARDLQRAGTKGGSRGKAATAVAAARRASLLNEAKAFEAETGRSPSTAELIARLGCAKGTPRCTFYNDMAYLRAKGLIPASGKKRGNPEWNQVHPRAGDFHERPQGYTKRALKAKRWTDEDEQVYQEFRQQWGPWLHWFAEAQVLPGARDRDPIDDPEREDDS